MCQAILFTHPKMALVARTARKGWVTSAMHLVELVLALVPPSVPVRQYAAPVAAVFEPFAIVAPPIGPDHVPSPRHLVVLPLALVSAIRQGSAGVGAPRRSTMRNCTGA